MLPALFLACQGNYFCPLNFISQQSLIYILVPSGCHENPPSPANDRVGCSLLLPFWRSSLPCLRAQNSTFPDFILWSLQGDFSGERSAPASPLRINPCSWSSLQREQAPHPITARDGSGNAAVGSATKVTCRGDPHKGGSSFFAPVAPLWVMRDAGRARAVQGELQPLPSNTALPTRGAAGQRTRIICQTLELWIRIMLFVQKIENEIVPRTAAITQHIILEGFGVI